MTDVGTITARIVAIADDITNVTADDQYPDNLSAVLPFCFVEEGEAAFQEINSDTVEVTQQWRLLFYIQAFDGTIQSEEDAAYQAVRPYLTSVPLYFWNRKRLQRSDQGLADVTRATLSQHEGIQSADREQQDYMGVAFTLTVVYDMRIDQV